MGKIDIKKIKQSAVHLCYNKRELIHFLTKEADYRQCSYRVYYGKKTWIILSHKKDTEGFNIDEKIAYHKLDNTLCLNSMDLQFNIDTDYHEDCADAYEMCYCLDKLEQFIENIDVQDAKKVKAYEDIEADMGLTVEQMAICTKALKGLINTFNITVDSKIRMSDELDGINGFAFYKDIVYHEEITKAVEWLKEEMEE